MLINKTLNFLENLKMKNILIIAGVALAVVVADKMLGVSAKITGK